MLYIQRLALRGLLSFPPDMEPIELGPLNVLIGPNGSGKSNLIHALELLHATTVDFNEAIQRGGGVDRYLWKGAEKSAESAVMDVTTTEFPVFEGYMRYRLKFINSLGDVFIIDEDIEDIILISAEPTLRFYYRYNKGAPVISTRDAAPGNKLVEKYLEGRPMVARKQSILASLQSREILASLRSQEDERKLSEANRYFKQILTLGEWTFGAGSSLRAPQKIEDPSDMLLPNARNLALVLNEISHLGDRRAFDSAMRRFLPRYEPTSTRIADGTAQIYIHESGLKNPIPSTRISDGTLRFLGIMAALFAPHPPTLLCLEEPELGLHPDAVATLARLLIEASDRMQIVVTTHSESLLSELGDRVESVLVCENHGHGTSIERLDAERLAFWLKDYALGDIWKIGEIGGNP